MFLKLKFINVEIPQCSFIGMLLMFLVYVYDKCYASCVKKRLFTDDTYLSFRLNDPDYVNSFIDKNLNP